MNRKTLRTSMIVAFAVFAMGAGLPGCPGNKALEEQVEQLQTKNADSIKKMGSIENQLKMMNAEAAQVKQQMPQVLEQMNVLKGRLDQLEAQVREMASKKTAPAAKPKAAKRR